MSEPEAKIILDSCSRDGTRRLVTAELKIHRFVLAEFNTHRLFCLAGDNLLEFDLPAGATSGHRRIHYITIGDFVDRWHNGANRIAANPKRDIDLTLIKADRIYTANELSEILGFAKSAIHNACRSNDIENAFKVQGDNRWYMSGQTFIDWRESSPEHTRFSVRDRLKQMQIRQLDEATGDIVTSTVTDCWYSGDKEVYTLRAGSFEVTATLDHQIYTEAGWLPLRDIKPGMAVVVKSFGKQPDDVKDANRLRKINGRWRSVWQREKRLELIDQYSNCMNSECSNTYDLQVHHIVPVYQDPSLAFEDSNIVLLCGECHKQEHSRQDWQGGTYLFGNIEIVESIEYRGVEMTYDLEIDGEYPNFLANGVVVHNSRNSASSRAIPVTKTLQRVIEDPAWPVAYPVEQPGMQGGEELAGEDLADALEFLEDIHHYVTDKLAAYVEAHEPAHRLHKSVLNRYIEPWMWHTVIVTASSWQNYFAQRCSPLAQPEIRVPSEILKSLFDSSTPTVLDEGEWHLPYVQDDERVQYSEAELIPISVARCARVSYLTHDGVRDVQKDRELYQRLVVADPPHWSPLEHVARLSQPSDTPYEKLSNFDGWIQWRKSVETAKGVNTRV